MLTGEQLASPFTAAGTPGLKTHHRPRWITPHHGMSQGRLHLQLHRRVATREQPRLRRLTVAAIHPQIHPLLQPSQLIGCGRFCVAEVIEAAFRQAPSRAAARLTTLR